MSLNWKQFELGILRPVLRDLAPTIASPEVAVRLVGETIWHESDRLQALGQYPRGDGPFGPGLGLCSMERSTWEWLEKDFLNRREELLLAFRRATGSMVCAYPEFAWNLALNVAGCRLRYFAFSAPLPADNLEARSRYWFIIYNTSGVEERRLKYIEDAKQIPWG